VHFFSLVPLLELIPALMPLFLGQIEAVINGFGIQSQIVIALGSKIEISLYPIAYYFAIIRHDSMLTCLTLQEKARS
jgi:hypothetical protein